MDREGIERRRDNVGRQISARHPLRCNLEGEDSRTLKWDDVRVNQPFPNQSLPAKYLLGHQNITHNLQR